MRNLKFRAWDKNKKCWFKTELTFYGFTLFGECTMICPPRIEDLQYLEITQFTGLLDKTGKEIYEGDIVKTELGTQPQQVFIRLGCWFVAQEKELGYYSSNEIEVVGNIYENPELIK